eukprot:2906325-Amphidinium_carterae.1
MVRMTVSRTLLTAAKEFSIPWRTSAPYEQQSHGAIERFHKTLFAQVRAIRFDLVDLNNLGQPVTGQCTGEAATLGTPALMLHKQ